MLTLNYIQIIWLVMGGACLGSGYLSIRLDLRFVGKVSLFALSLVGIGVLLIFAALVTAAKALF